MLPSSLPTPGPPGVPKAHESSRLEEAPERVGPALPELLEGLDAALVRLLPRRFAGRYARLNLDAKMTNIEFKRLGPLGSAKLDARLTATPFKGADIRASPRRAAPGG